MVKVGVILVHSGSKLDINSPQRGLMLEIELRLNYQRNNLNHKMNVIRFTNYIYKRKNSRVYMYNSRNT